MAGALPRPLPSWARLRLASTRACLTDPGRKFTPGSRRLFGCASVATGASARPLATAGHFIRKPSAPRASILEIFVSEFELKLGRQTVYILNVVNLRLRKQVAVRVLPAATCFISPPCGEVASVAQRPGREGANPWLSRRIRPEQLDLRARLLQVAQRRLRRGRRRRLPVDREVDVEPVLERPPHHRTAVQPREVDPAPREAVQRVRQAARPMRGDERDRPLPPRTAVARARRRALLDHDEPGAVFGV